MTTDSKKRKGTFGLLIDAFVAWENAMDYTPYDYVLDRDAISDAKSSS